MTGILCLIIALCVPTWRWALALACIVGIPLAVFVGIARAEDAVPYGGPLNYYFAIETAGVGALGFLLETMLFYAIKRGIITLWQRRSTGSA